RLVYKYTFSTENAFSFTTSYGHLDVMDQNRIQPPPFSAPGMVTSMATLTIDIRGRSPLQHSILFHVSMLYPQALLGESRRSFEAAFPVSRRIQELESYMQDSKYHDQRVNSTAIIKKKCINQG